MWLNRPQRGEVWVLEFGEGGGGVGGGCNANGQFRRDGRTIQTL